MTVIQDSAAAGSIDIHAVTGSDFEDSWRPAFLLARQLGCTPDEALDVVQDAAERAWRYRTSCNGPFGPWFLAIVYRVATRPRLRWLPLPASWKSSPVDMPEGFDPELSAALRRLPPRYRAALWLRYGEDQATVDVATVLNTTEAGAKQLLMRARTAIRKELNDGR